MSGVSYVLAVTKTTDAPVWWLFGATLALAVAAWLGLVGLLDARKTRRLGIFSELSRRWDDSLVLESLTLGREFGPSGTVELVEALWSPGVTKREKRDLDDWYKVSVYPNLLEAIGAYLADGAVDEKVVYQLWGKNAIDAWSAWRETVDALRKYAETDEVLVQFERLAERMQARLDWERSSIPRGWKDELRLFARSIGS